MEYDVAIIGGGPAGSTVASLLAKYSKLRTVILERERFPRDHVGESLLPVISGVLDEIGVWDQIEAADFPVKIGATYRWGRTDGLWDFEFLPGGRFQPQKRPAKYAGQRLRTAFQVDRSIYDKILLDHARSLGVEVREECQVKAVLHDGDRVTGLTVASPSDPASAGSTVTAKYYIDASGHAGLLRRTMGVEVECPTTLQNIAIWDYWQNAEWATSIGVGGTRIQVLSLPYGWLWFIPVGPKRTSIGFVVPAKYYKEQLRRPEDLYLEAVRSDPIVSKLIQNASREDRLMTTNDWSFVSSRLTGENWFLIGESAGFADPILSAGLSLAHIGARDVAYSILAMERGDHDPAWLRHYYCTTHRYQIRQHMRFAEFWYTANGVFSDLKDEAQRIATAAGLEITAEEAWRWLGQGGFIERNSGTSVGGYGLLLAKQIISSFTGDATKYEIVGKTHFLLDLEGAEKDWTAEQSKGLIRRHRMYRRNGKLLPMLGAMGWIAEFFRTERSFEDLARDAGNYLSRNRIPPSEYREVWAEVITALEAMVAEGWLIAKTVPGAAPVPPVTLDMAPYMHENHELHA